MRPSKAQLPVSPKAGPLIVVGMATLLVNIWFRKGMMMGTGDTGLPFYNPARLFEAAQYTWGGFGHFASLVNAAPFFFAISLLEGLGIPAFALQASTFWLVLVVGGLSVHYLTLTVLEGGRPAGVLAALFYILNPFAMVSVWNRLHDFMWFYALMPLVLLLCVKGLRLHRLEYAFYVGAASLLFAHGFGGPPLIGTFWLIILSYLAFHALTNLHDRPEALYAAKFSLATLASWLLLNAWWILPFLGTIGWPISRLSGWSPLINMGILLNVSSAVGPLIHVIRLIHHGFFTGIEVVWGPIYSSKAFTMMSFLAPLLAFSSLLFRPRRKLVLYFASLSVVGLFLAKGAAPPLGEAYWWTFTNFTAFQVFRDPFEKFGFILPLGYAPLLGVGFTSFYHWARGHAHIGSPSSHPRSSDARKVGATALIVLICLSIYGLYAWPMWTGTVFTSAVIPTNDPDVGYYVSVPGYYEDANLWVSSQQGDFRLLALPINGESNGITHKWAYGYGGAELSNQLFDKPSISGATAIPYVNDIVKRLEGALLSNPEQFWKVMALLDAKYIVVRSDVDYNARGMRAPEVITAALLTLPPSSVSDGAAGAGKASGVEGIRYARSFGKLDFYELDGRYSLPHIYGTDRFVLSVDIDAMLFADIEKDAFVPGDAVIFLLSQSDINDVKVLEDLSPGRLYKPTINFERVDPTKYIVRVEDATDPFFLILSETYHPQWRAYVNGEQIPEGYHFIANGYANSWYINKRGSYDVNLEFWPQRLLHLGSLVSLLTLVGFLAYLGWRNYGGALKALK